MSLVSLSLGFSLLGILIIVNRHRADLNGPPETASLRRLVVSADW
jgi:hypothetical protein